MNLLIGVLPVADWVESITSWFTNTFAGLFSFIQLIGKEVMDGVTNLLLIIPPIALILLITLAAYLVSNKKWGFPLFTLVGLLFILNQGLWSDLMNTLTLVLISSLLSIVIGVPLGILMAKNNTAQSIITPILDFMQTMPGFVYLIPAVAFFGIGMVPGVFASVIFALPPTVRFTNLGIRQVPTELVEAADSFGSTGKQKLFKLELPLAKNTILAGINQTTMLALSMVVIASMIGAPGLGRGVLSALQRAQVGNGFVSGVSLVILAIIIDRFTQYMNKPKEQVEKKEPLTQQQRRKKWTIGIVAAVVVILAGVGVQVFNGKQAGNKTVNLAYVEWDSEVASTYVIAEVLKQEGFNVNVTPLDNAIMWESIAAGEADASVSAWLPNTHAAQFKQYESDITLLGPNLEGAKVGLVVPTYMGLSSIEELTDQANKSITGIEPGAGVVTAAEEAIETYPNLSDWEVETSSSGAMVVALDQAIKNEEPIVITGWTPHWMFSKYDLTYLEDPKQAMGDAETINTISRNGFEADSPEAFHILKQFNWTTDDIETVMLAINGGEAPEKAAQEWIKNNPDVVASWTK